MVMGVHFEYLGSIPAPIPVPLISLGIYVELVHEDLDIILVFYGYEANLEFLSKC